MALSGDKETIPEKLPAARGGNSNIFPLKLRGILKGEKSQCLCQIQTDPPLKSPETFVGESSSCICNLNFAFPN